MQRRQKKRGRRKKKAPVFAIGGADLAPPSWRTRLVSFGGGAHGQLGTSSAVTGASQTSPCWVSLEAAGGEYEERDPRTVVSEPRRERLSPFIFKSFFSPIILLVSSSLSSPFVSPFYFPLLPYDLFRGACRWASLLFLTRPPFTHYPACTFTPQTLKYNPWRFGTAAIRVDNSTVQCHRLSVLCAILVKSSLGGRGFSASCPRDVLCRARQRHASPDTSPCLNQLRPWPAALTTAF